MSTIEIITLLATGAAEIAAAYVLLYGTWVICIDVAASLTVNYELEGEGKSIIPKLGAAKIIAAVLLFAAGGVIFNIAGDTIWQMTAITAVFVWGCACLLFGERARERWNRALDCAEERIVWREY